MSAHLSIPTRQCEAWCPHGDGHPGEHPADRSCIEFLPQVSLSLHNPVKMCSGDWSRDWFDVQLRRPPEAISPQVWVGWESTQADIKLTLDEAAALRDVLSAAIETATGQAQATPRG